MKKKPVPPNLRFILREWLIYVKHFNADNPNSWAMRDLNRTYRRALKEIKSLREGNL